MLRTGVPPSGTGAQISATPGFFCAHALTRSLPPGGTPGSTAGQRPVATGSGATGALKLAALKIPVYSAGLAVNIRSEKLTRGRGMKKIEAVIKPLISLSGC